ANIGLRYSFAKWLNAKVTYQYQKQGITSRNLADEKSFAARNLVNLYSLPNPAAGIVDYIVPLGGILNTSNNTQNAQNIRGQLNFSKTWRQHELVAIAGGEVRQIKISSYGNTVYGYD